VTKREKLRRKLRNSPTDATMQDVETLLTRFGFVLDRVSGSHHLFVYKQGETYRAIGFPLHGRKVKRVYVERVTELLDELFPLEDDSLEEDVDEQDN
jgi:predicted RNA binding protein YcfA (HicA-like mRNA interferase family)